jgi:hypothetical protein
MKRLNAHERDEKVVKEHIRKVQEVLTPTAAGAVLVSGSDTSSNPTWVGGFPKVLAAGTATDDATLDIALDTWSATYDVMKFFLWNLQPAVDGDFLEILFSDDGGATFEGDAADYACVNVGAQVTGTTETAQMHGDDSDAFITVGVDNFGSAAGELVSAEFTIFDPAGARRTHVHWQIAYWDNDATSAWNCDAGSATFLATTGVTDIRFVMSTGNIATCSYKLVGFTNAV